MTTYLITRHPGAIEWAARQGLMVDRQINHLDPEDIQPGDVVIGTLPVNLVAQVDARGGRFFNLTLELPPEARGRELSADDLERYGARLEGYLVQAVAIPSQPATKRERLRCAQALVQQHVPEGFSLVGELVLDPALGVQIKSIRSGEH